MRTPPPTVPGIAEANSKPRRPAARARCRQVAFVAPPPATEVPSVVSRHRGEFAPEAQDERLEPLVGDEHVRAEPDRLDREPLGVGRRQ